MPPSITPFPIPNRKNIGASEYKDHSDVAVIRYHHFRLIIYLVLRHFIRKPLSLLKYMSCTYQSTNVSGYKATPFQPIPFLRHAMHLQRLPLFNEVGINLKTVKINYFLSLSLSTYRTGYRTYSNHMIISLQRLSDDVEAKYLWLIFKEGFIKLFCSNLCIFQRHSMNVSDINPFTKHGRIASIIQS